MANHFQQFAEVQGKFTTAMIYPAMVCRWASGSMLFFIYFMLPKFIDMFQGFSLELPLPTRMLISIGYMFHAFLVVAAFCWLSPSVILFTRFQGHGSKAGANWTTGK